MPGQGGLAVSLAVGGLILMPLGWRGSVSILTDFSLLWLAIGTAILASLIPYSLELIAMRQLQPNVFAIFMALEPAFAATIGWIVLGQGPSLLKIAAIALVILASVNQSMGGRRFRRRRR